MPSTPDPDSSLLLTEAVQTFEGWDYLFLIVLLLLFFSSAMISGSEAAFFSLSPAEKDELEEEGGKRSNAVLKLLDKPRELLATILIANNFVNVGIVILSSFILQKIMSPNLSDGWRFFIEVIAITFVLLLLGEVIPKVYATKNALSFSKLMSITLYRLNKIPPVSWIRWLLVRGVKFIQGSKRRGKVSISTDELEQALALTKEEDKNEEEHKILEGIIKFGNTEVRQIMKARIDVFAIDSESTYKETMDLILDCGHSRIPVFEDNFDKIIGILFIKDLLPVLGQEDFDWLSVVRKPFFVTENRKIDDLLKDFQEKKVHMAMVVDEYGGTSGIVTLEDVLEEIVGDITDEFDEDDLVYTKIDENTYLFEGKTPLVDLYKVIDVDALVWENNSAETIGGLVIEIAGKIPKNNEYVEIDNLKIIVESSDKRRVKMVKIVKLEPQV